jgi:hypothetical protein
MTGFPGSASGPWCTHPRSPWPAPFSPPLRQSWRTKTIVREFRRYYGAVRLPAPVPHGRTPEVRCGPGGVHQARCRASRIPRTVFPCMSEIFDPARSAHPSPLRGQRGLPRVRITSAPRPGRLRNSILSLHLPLSTLRTSRCQEAHMAWGQRGWLDLRCPRLLLFNTLPAYPGADPNRRVHRSAPIT